MSYTATWTGANSVEDVETAIATDLNTLESDVQSAISAAGNDSEFTTGEALELQYTLAKWALLYEASSNLGKKLSDTISSAISNIR